MLIDSVCPVFQVRACYHTQVNAPVASVYQALKQDTFVNGSILCRALFRLREIPAWFSRKPMHMIPYEPLTLDEFLEFSPFCALAEQEGVEIVIGSVGRFWNVFDTRMTKLKGNQQFQAFDETGFGKAVLNFRLEASGAGTRLSTETRVYFPEEQYLKRFKRYWFCIGLFSGLIRRVFLRSIKDAAERGFEPGLRGAK